MKKVIIMITISVTFLSGTARAQNWNEWFKQKKTQKKYLVQQIAALQVYLGHVKKGYEIVQQGLTVIGDIEEGNFNLHNDYFASLEAVNPAISHSARVAYIMALQQLIDRDIQRLYQDSQNNENFTAGEMKYLSNVYANLLNECNASETELNSIITVNALQMTDDERLARIDHILDEMQDMLVFIRTFENSTRLLALQRDREYRYITIDRQIFDAHP